MRREMMIEGEGFREGKKRVRDVQKGPMRETVREKKTRERQRGREKETTSETENEREKEMMREKGR